MAAEEQYMDKVYKSKLDQLIVLNEAMAIQGFGDDKDMMIMMATQFESLSLDKILEKLYIDMQKLDWLEVQKSGHQLKGASGYIAAERFSWCCNKLQEDLKVQLKSNAFNEQENIQLYVQIMKEAISLKKELAKLLNKELDQPLIQKFESYQKEFEAKIIKEKKMTNTVQIKQQSQQQAQQQQQNIQEKKLVEESKCSCLIF